VGQELSFVNTLAVLFSFLEYLLFLSCLNKWNKSVFKWHVLIVSSIILPLVDIYWWISIKSLTQDSRDIEFKTNKQNQLKLKYVFNKILKCCMMLLKFKNKLYQKRVFYSKVKNSMYSGVEVSVLTAIQFVISYQSSFLSPF